MSTEKPKMDGVDEPKKLSTGIAELDEALSGGKKLDLSTFVSDAQVRGSRWNQMAPRLRRGETLVLDLEMDDPPDKRITP